MTLIPPNPSQTFGLGIATVLRSLAGVYYPVGRIETNSLYGCHQSVVEANGGRYRVIVAPLDAPVEIGGVPADEHFGSKP